MTLERIGFACKYLHHNQNNTKQIIEDLQKPLHNRVTTAAWLNRQSKAVAEERLWDLMQHNIAAYYKLVKYVGRLPASLRMVRLGSDILPVYSEATWSYFWQKPDVRAYCEHEFSRVGALARELDVRLSMHPGPYTVLASNSAAIVDNSVREIEYHADVIRWMGYGKKFQDFKCNVHISGKLGPSGILAVLPRLSTEARNTLTIENDENGWGIDASLELADNVALVLDIHHHWIRTGEYIQSNDDRFKRMIDSWRGVRPVIHYSVSREDLLVGFDPTVLPDMQSLLDAGYNKQKLRAHSDYMWNQAANEWALGFWLHADIMVESKMKNLASIKLYEQYLEIIKKVVDFAA